MVNILIPISKYPYLIFLFIFYCWENGYQIGQYGFPTKIKRCTERKKNNQKMLLERLCGNNHHAEAKNFVPKFTNEKSSFPSG